MARILIADDDRAYREQLKGKLHREGHHCILASNGHEAVKRYFQFKPDILFMDIVMPGKHGIMAAFEILGTDPKAKIAFLSVLHDKIDHPNLRESFHFFSKPDAPHYIGTYVHRVIEDYLLFGNSRPHGLV